ncbi:MAG: hypothetical protein ACOCUV_00995 [bacterium]
MALGILIIPDLYAKYERNRVIRELNRMCFVFLLLFIANTVICTALSYYPKPMYGMISGISYGGIYAAAFNSIPVVLFAFFIFNAHKLSYTYLSTGVISFLLLMITMRRSVALVSIFAILIVLFYLLYTKKARKLFIVILILTAAAFSLTFLGIADQFEERYDSRFHNRQLVSMDEGRFMDFKLVYKDLFVDNRYGKLFGFEFFNAPGNYGGGIFGDRNLHADIPLIVHASGMVGLTLYLLMILKSFKHSWRYCLTYMDKFIFLFCTLTFVVFTISGRITNTAYALSLFSVLMIPIANSGRYEKHSRFVLR